ncbi:MAG: CHAT domain-containing protein, partial [Bacteroidales bacterium]|nr:CHAT domain-containing protein [Bacteroidales bacterium]
DKKNLSRLYEKAFEIASFLDDETKENLLYTIESGRFVNFYHLEDYDMSRKSMEWVIEKDKTQFLALQNILSVQERANFSGKLINLVEYNNYLMLFPEDPEVISNALNNRLFIKGLLMESERSHRDALSKTGDTIVLKMHEEYLSAKISLANLRSEFGVDHEILDSMESGIMQLEKEVSRRLGEAMALGDRSLNWKDIRDSLDEDEAAVEVIMFYHRTPPPRITYHPWYMAFIITSDMKDSPLYLRMFDAVEVIPDYEAYRGSMDTGSEDRSLDPGLYDRLWSKIDSVVEGKKTIYFSPDGLYHQVNVEALTDREENHVINKYEIRYVNTLADLLQEDREYGDNRRALLAGDPSFRMSLTSIPDPVPVETSRSVSEFQSRMFPGTYLSELPGTRTEVDSIGSMLESMGWDCSTLTGPAATEDAIASVQNPRILHLATHGFYAQNASQVSDSASNDNTRSYNFLDIDSYSRSCLFFSGAQSTLFYAYDYQEGSGDGILTAWEIMEMDLDSTELVVLSACETGLGDVLNSEGVNGLRRAFHLAGAKRVLISLWEVDDQATQLLMRKFYSGWLSGMDIDQSLAHAKRYLMTETEYAHSRYWAAFILSGI